MKTNLKINLHINGNDLKAIIKFILVALASYHLGSTQAVTTSQPSVEKKVVETTQQPHAKTPQRSRNVKAPCK
jgi:hypothetical protein